MKSTDGKVLDFDEGIKKGWSYYNVLGAKLGNVYEISPCHDIETYLWSLHRSFDSSNNGNLEGLLLGYSLEYADGKVLSSDDDNKLLLFVGKVLGTILGDVHGITLGLDIWTELGSLGESVDGSNDGKLDVLLLGHSLGSTDGKVLGFYEVIKMVLSDDKVLGTIFGYVVGIIWNLLMVKCLALKKVSNWDLLMKMCLSRNLEL